MGRGHIVCRIFNFIFLVMLAYASSYESKERGPGQKKRYNLYSETADVFFRGA